MILHQKRFYGFQFFVIDAENGNIAGAVFAAERLYRGQLMAARWAPGGPEIKEHDLAA